MSMSNHHPTYHSKISSPLRFENENVNHRLQIVNLFSISYVSFFNVCQRKLILGNTALFACTTILHFLSLSNNLSTAFIANFTIDVFQYPRLQAIALIVLLVRNFSSVCFIICALNRAGLETTCPIILFISRTTCDCSQVLIPLLRSTTFTPCLLIPCFSLPLSFSLSQCIYKII